MDANDASVAPTGIGTVLAGLGRGLPTDDLVHAMLPLMRQVAALHEQGRVARLGLADVIEDAEGRFRLTDPAGIVPTANMAAIHQVQPQASSALKVVGEYRVTHGGDAGARVDDLRARADGETLVKPIYLTDLRSWEIELGHHDEITDVFQIGMLLACAACALDPRDPAAIERFSFNRSNLFAIAPRLHPVVASIIVEATALNRHDRATDLAGLARRLETYRDQPVDLDVDRVLADAKAVPDRRVAVLSHLRDRLFDLSRRNRLIHFRPTQSSVNLTEASIPIVMRIEAVRADRLCTWQGRFVDDVLAGKALPLNKWLRFEDQPHLPSAFDRIIQETRRDRAEYGFNHLRLVIGFLRWHNLKEAPDERIVSPLLWLPVEIAKAKGVRDQYVLRCPETVAEYNPALRHMLRQLYDIQLPEEVDLATVSLADIHADLAAQIHRSEPGVRLDLQERPQIRLILQKAIQRVNRFNRRRGTREAVSTRTDFSYDRDDYRPLGLALFEKFVKPAPLPQRLAAGGSLRQGPARMVAETEALTYSAGVDEGHRFAWEIDLTQVTLANLNYRKMSLVRDFSQLIDAPSDLPAFDQVFSIDPRPFTQEAPPPIPAPEQWSVVPSDATQDAAVALARTGRNFIIQGPPGTGKSQTITNLIADYAGRGKRVLFVCEKRAALDVVFHRLGQAGLDGLACIIHDSQEDKKGFIADLKTHYESWGTSDDALDRHRAIRARTGSALAQHLDSIARYDAAVGAAQPQSLRTLVRRAAALPPPPDAFGPRQREALPTLPVWDAHRALAERISRALRDHAGADSLAAHPFAALTAATLTGDQPYARIETAIDAAETLLQRLEDWIERGEAPVSGATPIAEAAEAGALAARLVRTGLAASPDLLDPATVASRQLDADLADLDRLRTRAAAAAAEAANWRDAFSRTDNAAALALAEEKEGSFFAFLSGPWRALKANVAARYDFAAHAVPPKIGTVLQLLAASHDAGDALDTATEALRAKLHTGDLDALLTLRAELTGGARSPLIQAMLVAGATAIAAMAAQADALAQLRDTATRILDDTNPLTFDAAGELLRDLRESLGDLPDLLPVLADLHRADPTFAGALRKLRLPLTAIEALVVDEAIARIERSDPEIRRFDIARLVQATRRAAAARTRLRKENADAIRSTLHRTFRDHVKASETSVTLLDPAGREFKKLFAAGRREVEHEFGKTMRHRSIRDLVSSASGAVVNDLKPIWLMSPLSVSDTLPLRTDLFDVVIFDEASQIPVEEAVPALCRSTQVVIVGDEMQLPPTNFFSASLGEEEASVIVEEDGERIGILLDADSLLNQAARNLPATLLAWHYRSRSEALISFSNAAFYAGQLVTIPDRDLRTASGPAAPVRSDDEGGWATGTDRLLAAPITAHRIADGRYEGRINPPEAAYIAGLVRELLARGTGATLGIVAFSEAQQSEIEGALDRLAAADPAFAAAVEQEYVREDDGQHSGLFVKNLENVQGDERDIIIMSVCYAPGRNGRMAMNFGPINQRGGEKRLNVIFSRARRHMAIVSSIAPEAITNVHNDGARALRSFLTFAEAQSSGEAAHAQAVLTTLNPDAARAFGTAPPADAVRHAIADALRARGHDVREHVGSASFRCDLAIVAPDGASYALGILLDRDSAERAVEERFVFRPSILRAFGWRVIDVPVASWLRARDETIERVEAELARSSWDLADDDPYAGVALAPDGETGPAAAPGAFAHPVAAAVEVPASAAGAGLTEYRLVEGASNKFWRVGVDGGDLIVEFGRIGTKGQRVIKSFEDEARARREATKLTLEKTRKGYQEAG
ncbi:AAA domain-containing protein [Sphingomonas jatrophae]|uniref:AAA domain-containing protein n=1 Tax=Sphingomonas jatrophae TaxID=1166337 RepID=A0A1I6M7V6_9SPHN|nr:AAA domain-containing protein [Sphingomonas jatrophae]SFS11825.1 AAA domain-containing protein [Sphingomonas jatrophae]